MTTHGRWPTLVLPVVMAPVMLVMTPNGTLAPADHQVGPGSLTADSGAHAGRRTAAAPVPAHDLRVAAAARRAVTDLPRHSGTGRRVVYSLHAQRVWTVGSKGRVKQTYLVSGRLSQPAPGHYRVYSKSRWTRSSVSDETMQYMVRFAHGTRTGAPIGFHSIPRDRYGHAAQTVKQLGKPLSAGCIRQRLRDAAFLWRFAHVGTRVVVIS